MGGDARRRFVSAEAGEIFSMSHRPCHEAVRASTYRHRVARLL
jgi:hypothetical protein